MPDGGRKRRALEQVATSASSLLALAIVVMVNYLAFRHYERVDWTSQGMFTLSPKSKQVLRELDKDIDLYLFMSRGEPNFGHDRGAAPALQGRDAAAQGALRRSRSPAGRVQGAGPALRRGGRRHGSGDAVADVAAVLARGDKHWHISREDLVGWEGGGEDGADQDQREGRAGAHRRDRAGRQRQRRPRCA